METVKTEKDRDPLEGSDRVGVGCGARVGDEGQPLKLTLKPRLWGERSQLRSDLGRVSWTEGTGSMRSRNLRALDSLIPGTHRKKASVAGAEWGVG